VTTTLPQSHACPNCFSFLLSPNPIHFFHKCPPHILAPCVDGICRSSFSAHQPWPTRTGAYAESATVIFYSSPHLPLVTTTDDLQSTWGCRRAQHRQRAERYLSYACALLARPRLSTLSTLSTWSSLSVTHYQLTTNTPPDRKQEASYRLQSHPCYDCHSRACRSSHVFFLSRKSNQASKTRGRQ
jgi:hypothetical protein